MKAISGTILIALVFSLVSATLTYRAKNRSHTRLFVHRNGRSMQFVEEMGTAEQISSKNHKQPKPVAKLANTASSPKKTVKVVKKQAAKVRN